MNKTLTILGSTGSIGKQAVEVARLRGFEITALAADSNVDELEKQIYEFKPKIAAMQNEKAALELKRRVSGMGVKVLAGSSGVCECAAAGAKTVLNSVVGIAGLRPTLSAIEAGSDIALANKETMVAGGEIVMRAAKEKNIKILPVDSEHSAIFQSIQGCPNLKMIKRLILTASGGPFFGKSKEELKSVSLKQALKHPNWSMGAKITIDSATMMNKGLELIEAAWLFNIPPNQIDILVHRQSIVHSLVEFSDNSVIAQLGLPDMRVPIQYALTYPERFESPAGSLRLEEWGKLTFDLPDYEAFPCINLCRRAINEGGLVPAAANAANEEANRLFREGKIAFQKIAELVEFVIENTNPGAAHSLENIFETDKTSRETVLSKI